MLTSLNPVLSSVLDKDVEDLEVEIVELLRLGICCCDVDF